MQAKLRLSEIFTLQGLNTECKLLMVKALIIPTLLYPVVPLNTASKTNIQKLQSCLNKALKFVFNVRYPQVATAASLHTRAKLVPINQKLHQQSKNIWTKISEGIAGDLDKFNTIIGMNMVNKHRDFPSSYDRASKATPTPICTNVDTKSRAAKAYYIV